MKKSILSFVAVFSLGAVAATGFPTFWQYIESLSGDFLNNETTRNSVISEPISSGELLKANALNAKFGALKKELDSIKINVNSLGSGMTMVSTLGCSSVCYAIVNGIAEGESIARDFLVSLSSTNAQIVTRYGNDNASSVLANSFDIDYNTGYYANNIVNGGDISKIIRTRITSNEFSFLGCSSNNCYGFVNGRGEGETDNRNFLVVLSSSTAQIVTRYGNDNASSVLANSFDIDANTGYYANNVLTGGNMSKIMRTRVTQGEFELKACGSVCYGFLSGRGEGEGSDRNFAVVLSSTTAQIVTRYGNDNATSILANSFDIDATTGYYANNVLTGGDMSKVMRTRIVASELNIQKCSSTVCYGSLVGRGEGEGSDRNFAVVLSSTTAQILTRYGNDNATSILANSFDIDYNTGYYANNVNTNSVTLPLPSTHPVYKARITFTELNLGFSN